jgi:hypothetical protein
MMINNIDSKKKEQEKIKTQIYVTQKREYGYIFNT